MRFLSTLSGWWWSYGFTFTSLPPQMLLQICESWLKSYLMQVCKPCHYALVEAVEPFKLHCTSMWYIYKRFEHLLRLWMGIWLHTHTVTITDASPDLGKFAEILPDASVQTIPLHFGWDCRTFQTVSHVPIITYMRCLSTLSGWWWAYGFTITPLPPQTFPQICESWLKSYLMQVCKPCHYSSAEAVEPFQTASHVHVIHIWGVWAPSQVVDGHMASQSHCYHHRHFPRFVWLGWNPTWCKCSNHAITLSLRL